MCLCLCMCARACLHVRAQAFMRKVTLAHAKLKWALAIWCLPFCTNDERWACARAFFCIREHICDSISEHNMNIPDRHELIRNPDRDIVRWYSSRHFQRSTTEPQNTLREGDVLCNAIYKITVKLFGCARALFMPLISVHLNAHVNSWLEVYM